MKNDFKCPDCKGYLNIGEDVIFSIRTKKWPGTLLLLRPGLGDYSFRAHRSFKFKEGEAFDFYCPICLKRLASDKHGNLAKVLMTDEKKRVYEIYFSRRAGEQSTFKIIGEHTEYFGKDAKLYVDFFDLNMMT